MNKLMVIVLFSLFSTIALGKDFNNILTLTMVMKEPGVLAFIERGRDELNDLEVRYVERDFNLDSNGVKFKVNIDPFEKVWIERSDIYTSNGCVLNRFSLGSVLEKSITLPGCVAGQFDRIADLTWFPDHRLLVAAGTHSYFLDNELNVINHIVWDTEGDNDRVTSIHASTYDHSYVLISTVGKIKKYDLTTNVLRWAVDIRTLYGSQTQVNCLNVRCADVDNLGNIFLATREIGDSYLARDIVIQSNGRASVYSSYSYGLQASKDFLVGNDNELYQLGPNASDYNVRKVTTSTIIPIFQEVLPAGEFVSTYNYNARRIVNAGPYIAFVVQTVHDNEFTDKIHVLNTDILFKSEFENY